MNLSIQWPFPLTTKPKIRFIVRTMMYEILKERVMVIVDWWRFISINSSQGGNINREASDLSGLLTH